MSRIMVLYSRSSDIKTRQGNGNRTFPIGYYWDVDVGIPGKVGMDMGGSVVRTVVYTAYTPGA